MCAAIEPGVFQVVNGRSTPSVEETLVSDDLLEAAESCPVGAIELRAVDSGELLER
jgi:ferredoxin